MIKNLSILILAGGKGQRLMPITKAIPKPLIKINNKEFISYLIDSLNKFDYHNMTILTGYKSELINKYISKKYKKFSKIKTKFTGVDNDILSRIKLSVNNISDDVLICYGDTLADVNLNNLFKFYKSKKNKMVITTYPYQSNFGIIFKNKLSKIISFKEKPKLNFDINIGYILLEKKKLIKSFKFKNFENFLKKNAQYGQVYSYRHNGKHITINTLQELNEAKKFLK